ncbi:MAG: 30S ribosomal protein S17 [Myxococcota bacterium]|nr:30S ribosomal protein S17 [Myxococcota bacterium]
MEETRKEPEARRRRALVGVVVSSAMDKTAVVEFVKLVPHPQYKKFVRYRKKFMAHDEANQCEVGDRVRIVETRPLSRHKRWRVQEILEKAVKA